jgi:hypothetical protein
LLFAASVRDPPGSGSFRAVVIGVLEYLVQHPEAKDTLEGIVRWWRPAAGGAWTPEDVKAALAFLSARSWVTVRNVGNGATLYGARTERLAEMKAFLAEMKRGRGR